MPYNLSAQDILDLIAIKVGGLDAVLTSENNQTTTDPKAMLSIFQQFQKDIKELISDLEAIVWTGTLEENDEAQNTL